MSLRKIASWLLLLAIAPLFASIQVRADDLLLGNPSKATDNPENKDNYLMKKPYFVLSYNSTKGIPNWVSWQVTADHLGDAPRKRTFATDSDLPANLTKVDTKDYTNSGFDRGHLCPHSDRAANKEMSYSTFVMTNIIPQAPNVNQKAWNQLEIYARELVEKQKKRLYIIAGPAGTGGRGKLGFASDLKDKVTVPAKCWKIIVVLSAKDKVADDLSKIDDNTRVIAVIMPNDNSLGYDWAKYRTSVKEIEKLTKYHFFSALPEDVQKALKAEADDATIPPPVPPIHGDE